MLCSFHLLARPRGLASVSPVSSACCGLRGGGCSVPVLLPGVITVSQLRGSHSLPFVSLVYLFCLYCNFLSISRTVCSTYLSTSLCIRDLESKVVTASLQ
jgi:hypothetical protein